MNTGDWIFYYATQTVEWLNPIVSLVGLVIAIWAFRRCRKWGYLMVAFYFALSVFTLLAMPSINRAIRAHQAPDYDAQVEQKINVAITEAVDKVLAEEGRPYGIPAQRTIHFPFGPMILVAGLWLLAKREPHSRAEQVTTTPNDE
jgi:hypothetical protein